VKEGNMGRACSKHGGKRTYGVLVGRPAGKRPLGRPKFRKEDNIRMDGTEW
jgi:hypothetical protein